MRRLPTSVRPPSVVISRKLSKVDPYGTQELSYRQQIARQLRTQYTDGIYRHKYYTVTLKSRLRVTQGHWKRNHWIVTFKCGLEVTEGH